MVLTDTRLAEMVSKISQQKYQKRRLNILHLGFEDFRRPGSGGGAIRTHEINKRIAPFHDVTVLTSNYHGSIDRTEDGVRYIHIGRPWGYFGSILTYFAALPFVAFRHKADLIVEDFAAPFSSSLTPLWSRRKHVAMVQWLNAKEKSRQYHLPFWLNEKLGLFLHKQYIAVSSDLADKIHSGNSKASVDVIGNGVSRFAFDEPLGQNRHDILYVGRLERSQKGLDLLFESYSKISDRTNANLILLGDGPDENWAHSRVAALGLAKRVKFLGRVNGQAKHSMLSRAKVVAMPSRFETFGMVAIEALAAGTNIIAYEIPCLREVIPSDLGTLVTPFDTNEFAEELLKAQGDKADTVLEKKRRLFAAKYDWDVLAELQRNVYERLATSNHTSNRKWQYQTTNRPALEALFKQLSDFHSNKRSKAKIALIGNYGNGNTGDEAILAGIVQLASPYVEISALARSAKEISPIQGLSTVNRKSWQGIKTLLTSDVVAIGGGGMFGKGMPPLVKVLPIVGLALSFMGKKIVFVCIGAYPDSPRFVATTLRMLARRSYAVTVRESVTGQLLSHDNKGRRLPVFPVVVDDPAIALTPASFEEIARTTGLTRSDRKRRLLISLKPSPDPRINDAQVAIAATAADAWAEITGSGVDFICLSAQGDFGYGESLTDKTLSVQAMAACKNNSEMTLLGPNLPPSVAKGLIANAPAIIGSRLHAMIFAHATSTPLFGLAFEMKSTKFLRDNDSAFLQAPFHDDSALLGWLSQVAQSTLRKSA